MENGIGSILSIDTDFIFRFNKRESQKLNQIFKINTQMFVKN